MRRHPILVVGGTGKTGRRVAEKLAAKGHPVRATSRSGPFAFDWSNPIPEPDMLRDVQAAYVTYYPDLAVPGADRAIAAFTRAAVDAGIRHIVLLSGRGEAEAEISERIVQKSGANWTILRANWFCQNFSESHFRDGLLAGELMLPVGEVREPFVDAEDIADVAVAALTEVGHAGKVYELSGPRALTFTEAVHEIAGACGRDLRFTTVPFEGFADALRTQQVPEDLIDLLRYLFGTVLDGRNAAPTNGVQQALGRLPRDFADFARDAAAAGVWDADSARLAS